MVSLFIGKAVELAILSTHMLECSGLNELLKLSSVLCLYHISLLCSLSLLFLLFLTHLHKHTFSCTNSSKKSRSLTYVSSHVWRYAHLGGRVRVSNYCLKNLEVLEAKACWNYSERGKEATFRWWISWYHQASVRHSF